MDKLHKNIFLVKLQFLTNRISFHKRNIIHWFKKDLDVIRQSKSFVSFKKSEKKNFSQYFRTSEQALDTLMLQK